MFYSPFMNQPRAKMQQPATRNPLFFRDIQWRWKFSPEWSMDEWKRNFNLLDGRFRAKLHSEATIPKLSNTLKPFLSNVSFHTGTDTLLNQITTSSGTRSRSSTVCNDLSQQQKLFFKVLYQLLRFFFSLRRPSIVKRQDEAFETVLQNSIPSFAN